MRTTLNIDDSLLAQAGEYTGETEKTALDRMGLEALIKREAATESTARFCVSSAGCVWLGSVGSGV